MLAGPSSIGDDQVFGLAPSGSNVVLGVTLNSVSSWAGDTLCDAGSHCAVLAEAMGGVPVAAYELGPGLYGVTLAPGDGGQTWFAGQCSGGGSLMGVSCGSSGFVGTLTNGSLAAAPFATGGNVQGFRGSALGADYLVAGGYSSGFTLANGSFTTTTSTDVFVATFDQSFSGTAVTSFGGPGYDQVMAVEVSPDQSKVAIALELGTGAGSLALTGCPAVTTSSSTILYAVVVLSPTGSCLAARGFQKGTELHALAWRADSSQLLVGGAFVQDDFGDSTSYDASIPTVTGYYPTDGFIATYTATLQFLQVLVLSTPDDRDEVTGFAVSGGQAWATGDTDMRAGAMSSETLSVGGRPGVSPLRIATGGSSAANYFTLPLTP